MVVAVSVDMYDDVYFRRRCMAMMLTVGDDCDGILWGCWMMMVDAD